MRDFISSRSGRAKAKAKAKPKAQGRPQEQVPKTEEDLRSSLGLLVSSERLENNIYLLYFICLDLYLYIYIYIKSSFTLYNIYINI